VGAGAETCGGSGHDTEGRWAPGLQTSRRRRGFASGRAVRPQPSRLGTSRGWPACAGHDTEERRAPGLQHAAAAAMTRRGGGRRG
jgi:hypothetical protein